MRAEPISLLYGKSRVLHRRGLNQLEAEMIASSRGWDRAVDANRLDAAGWGITRLSKVIRPHYPNLRAGYDIRIYGDAAIKCDLLLIDARLESVATKAKVCAQHHIFLAQLSLGISRQG
jgi:hypothetical protein